MKSNGLEGKITQFIREQRKANDRLEKMLKEQQRLMDEERKLKAGMIVWLKEHHTRLSLHWEEIIHRTVK